MEFGNKENKNKTSNLIISKPNPNYVNGIEVVHSKESNLVKETNEKIKAQLKQIKDEDLDDLPELD